MGKKACEKQLFKDLGSKRWGDKAKQYSRTSGRKGAGDKAGKKELCMYSGEGRGDKGKSQFRVLRTMQYFRGKTEGCAYGIFIPCCFS